MTVLFNKFKFHNLNGIEVQVLLEAPIGTTILDLRVGPQSDANVPRFSVKDLSSLK